MRRTLTSVGVVVVGVGFLSLSACAASRTDSDIAMSAGGMNEITALYEQATSHERRAFRKPVRDRQARARRMLISKVDALLAQSASSESGARLTAEGDESFRDSLEQLKLATKRGDRSAMRTHHAAAVASCGK